MVKIVWDDLYLKDEFDNIKMCSNCDVGKVEDPRLIILQCPYSQTETDDMFENLRNFTGYFLMKEKPHSVFSTIFGGRIPSLATEQPLNIWERPF